MKIFSYCFSFFIFCIPFSVWAYNGVDKQKNVVRVSVATLPSFLSPYAKEPLHDEYSHLFFDTLIRWDTKHKLENRLIKKWKNTEEGVYRFYLKKHVLFHSGNGLSSKDVIWSFLQMKKSGRNQYLLNKISHISVINNTTFDIHSKLPQKSLFDLLTHLFILDSRFYKQYKISANTKVKLINEQAKRLRLPLSGTGPFKIERFNVNLNMKVSKNPQYWAKSPIQFEFNFILIKSSQLRVLALLSNDVAISESISDDFISMIKRSDQHENIQTVMTRSYILTVSPNHGSSLLKTAEDRKFFQLALNQKGMVKHLLYNAGTAGFYFSDMGNDNLVALTPLDIRYAPKQAMRYFQKSDQEKVMTLLVLNNTLTNMQKTITAITNMLSRVGIHLNTDIVENEKEWFAKKYSYDLALNLWQTNLVDFENIYQDLFEKSHFSPLLLGKMEIPPNKDYVEQAFNLFSMLQLEGYLLPLFSQHERWAGDKIYNFSDIFSVNGIPYWEKLREKEITKSKKS